MKETIKDIKSAQIEIERNCEIMVIKLSTAHENIRRLDKYPYTRVAWRATNPSRHHKRANDNSGTQYMRIQTLQDLYKI